MKRMEFAARRSGVILARVFRGGATAAIAASLVVAAGACGGDPQDGYTARPATAGTNSAAPWKEFVQPSSMSGCPSPACSDILALVQAGAGTRTVPSDLTPGLSDAQNDLRGPEGGDCSELPVSGLDRAYQPCVFDAGVPATAPMMILIGNSRALMWSQALLAVSSELGYRFGYVQREGCSMPRVANPTRRGMVSAQECREWQDAATNWVNQQNPRVVLVASGTNLSDSVSAAELPAGYAATLREFHGPGRQIVVIGDGPSLTESPPACLARNSSSALRCANPASASISTDEQRADLEAAQQAGAGYVNVLPWLCTLEICPAIIGNYLAYRDQSHLSTAFTKSLVPVLRQALNVSPA